MSPPVRITHSLDEKDWRAFYNAHFSCDRRFKLRFIYGTVTWLIGAAGLLGLFDNKPIAFGMIVFGLYCVFIKQYLINRTLNRLKKNPWFPGSIDYRFDAEKISGRDQGKEFEIDWRTLHGYRESKPGLLFYPRKDLFFFIPREAMTAEQQTGILQLLHDQQVSELGKPTGASEQKGPQQ